MTAAEVCDGANLGGKACADMGYASGTPTCSADCGSVITVACDDCVTPASDPFSCGDVPGGAPGAWVEIAATDSEVGLAYLTRDWDGNNAEIRFVRLGPSLNLLGSSTLERNAGWAPLAVAPIASGWVVAACIGFELVVHALDSSGRSVARTRVGSETCEGAVRLTARPGGGPLLTWATGSPCFAAVIGDDGRSATSPVTLSSFPNDGVAGAAHVGDAFYVVISTGNSNEGQLLRVGHDGRLGDPVVALPGESVRMPTLVAGASDLQIVYLAQPSGGDPAIVWRRIDTMGAATSPPLRLVGWEHRPVSALAAGTDAVVFVKDDMFASPLAMGRVGADGRIATPIHAIERGPTYVHGFARRGPDVIAAWVRSDDGRIRIARLMP